MRIGVKGTPKSLAPGLTQKTFGCLGNSPEKRKNKHGFGIFPQHGQKNLWNWPPPGNSARKCDLFGMLNFRDLCLRLLVTSNYIGDRNVTNWMMWGLRYSNCIPFFARTFAFPPTQKTILLLIFVKTDTFSLMKRLVVQELIVLESQCILFPLAQECLGCHGVSKTMCFDTPGWSGVSIAWIKLVCVSIFNFFGPSCSFFGVHWCVHNFPGNNSTGHLKHEKISNDQVQLFFWGVGSTSCNCEVWTFWCFFFTFADVTIETWGCEYCMNIPCDLYGILVFLGQFSIVHQNLFFWKT